MQKFEFTVEKEDAGLGLRRLLKRRLSFSSRLLAKLRAEKRVFLNGEVLEGWMVPKAGDTITALLPEEQSHFPPEDIPLHIIYEDEDLLVINKQPGITVHPTYGHPDHTLANGLMKHMEDSGSYYKIRFVNRLDMDTSGLLIVGKNSHTQDDIVRQMQSNGVDKRYIAIVDGAIDRKALPNAGIHLTDLDDDTSLSFLIDLPIGGPEQGRADRFVTPGGNPSLTHVQIIRKFKAHTLVGLRLETGRTHQIRVHLSHLGFPILGDPLYNPVRSPLISRQALHSHSLSFRHPRTGKALHFDAPLPEDMDEVLQRLIAAEKEDH